MKLNTRDGVLVSNLAYSLGCWLSAEYEKKVERKTPDFPEWVIFNYTLSGFLSVYLQTATGTPELHASLKYIKDVPRWLT
jgi:hypothetical protein